MRATTAAVRGLSAAAVCIGVLIGAMVVVLIGMLAAATGAEAACDLKAKYPQFVGKTLRVGTTADSPPYNYRDENDLDKIIGLNADYMRAIGACLGMPVSFAISDFSGIIPGVQAGHIEIGVSTVQYRPERAKQVNFIVYMRGSSGAVVRKDNPIQVKSFADLCGLKAAATVGSAQRAQLDDVNKTICAQKPIEITTTPGGMGGPMLVQNKRADFFFGVSSVQSYDLTLFRLAYTYTSDLKIGLVMNKANTELSKAVLEAMQTLQADGTEAKLYKRYQTDPVIGQPAEFLDH
jgi:polar amino acid transport system substrate-binding protein